MKHFRINEYGKDVWLQPINGKSSKDYSIDQLSRSYRRYIPYFQNLMEVIGSVLDDFDLALNVTIDNGTYMALYLTDEQVPMAKEVANAIHCKFKQYPNKINHFTLKNNNVLIIKDSFFRPK